MNSCYQNLLTRNMEKSLVSLYSRKKRYEENLCICEGFRASRELYLFKPDLIEYAVINEKVDASFFKGVKVYRAKGWHFDKISATVNSQGILLVARIPKEDSSNKIATPFALVIDMVADPGNMGTILRSCVSVGLKDIWYSKSSVDPYSEKTIRSAMCAQFMLNLHSYSDVDILMSELQNKGFQTIFRAEPAGGESCFESEKLFDKSIIIFGNEANGIKDVKNSYPLNIPMPGKFESLNVAQSVTVVLFEAVRRKVLK